MYFLTVELWAMLKNVPSMISLLLAPDLACDKGVSEVAGNATAFRMLERKFQLKVRC